MIAYDRFLLETKYSLRQLCDFLRRQGDKCHLIAIGWRRQLAKSPSLRFLMPVSGCYSTTYL